MKRTVVKLVVVTMAATAFVGMVAGPAGAKTKCPKGTTAVAKKSSKSSKGKKVTVCKATTPVGVKVGETDTSHMNMTLDVSSVPAGPVTFTVKNKGAKIHEFIVLETPVAAKDLKIDAATDRIDEDAYKPVGEAADIQPGSTGTLTVDLSAGHYALVCNVKGHVRMLMMADLTVT